MKFNSRNYCNICNGNKTLVVIIASRKVNAHDHYNIFRLHTHFCNQVKAQNHTYKLTSELPKVEQTYLGYHIISSHIAFHQESAQPNTN